MVQDSAPYPPHSEGASGTNRKCALCNRLGAGPGAPVAPFYKTSFEFTGTIHSVTFDVSGDGIEDSEAEMRRVLAQQLSAGRKNIGGVCFA